MNPKTIISVFFCMVFAVFCLEGCDSTSTAVKKDTPRIINVDASIIGTWKIVETNAMGSDLDMVTTYAFTEDGKCRKKNIFDGYAEEIMGVYSLLKNTLTIDFENNVNETFEFSFESKDKLKMIIIVDQTKLIYSLDRQKVFTNIPKTE
ncbi:MAG: hypothetical protein KAI43_08645 [Candidatus Aureabacteria bacterium]|nr:hypothetical protein [Candidatus Auribacterota bacterium]